MRTANIFIFLGLVTSFCFGQNELVEIKDFGPNPGNLEMFLHKPQREPDTIKHKALHPLVVVLHGCNQTVKSIAREAGWNKLADRFDFYVIYPGQNRLNNPSDCFNWYNEKDISKNSGESGSIKQMIDHMRKNYGIDSTQIFVYGASAGGAMTSVLLATYPELFNAGAVLAGGPYKIAENATKGLSAMLNPKDRWSKELGELVLKSNPGYTGKFPRLIVAHGKKDKIVDPMNSLLLIKQWAYVLRTDTVPSESKKAFAGHQDVTRHLYETFKRKTAIVYYEIDNLGHALMVDPGDGEMQGGEKGLFSKDKDFFSTYWIARDFGLIP